MYANTTGVYKHTKKPSFSKTIHCLVSGKGLKVVNGNGINGNKLYLHLDGGSRGGLNPLF